MFPDSNIVQNLNCGPTKLSYLICFGIALYFKQLFASDLKDAPCFVLSFNDSLNQELQQEQIDCTVRYFKNDQVRSRYFPSFLGHTRAEHLKKKFEATTDLIINILM